MNMVVQEDGFGCGVACVASILGISYQEAVLLFPNGKHQAKTKGFFCRDIVEVLSNAKLLYSYKNVRAKSQLYQIGSIIFLKRSKQYPSGHFLVRTGSGWMDTWINFPNLPRESGFRKRLPEKPIYQIYPNV